MFLISVCLLFAQADSTATGGKDFDIPGLLAIGLKLIIPILVGFFAGLIFGKIGKYKTAVLALLDLALVACKKLNEKYPDKNWDDVLTKFVVELREAAYEFWNVPMPQ